MDKEDINASTLANHKDIEKLEESINERLKESINENTEAIEDLTDTIKGNGNDGLLARIYSLEAKMGGLWFGVGVLLTGLVTGFIMLLV